MSKLNSQRTSRSTVHQAYNHDLYNCCITVSNREPKTNNQKKTVLFIGSKLWKLSVFIGYLGSANPLRKVRGGEKFSESCLTSANAVSEEGNPCRISSKSSNVFLNPPKGKFLVMQAVVWTVSGLTHGR